MCLKHMPFSQMTCHHFQLLFHSVGTRVHTFLWARAPSDNQVHMDFILLDASKSDAGTKNDPHGDFSVAVSGKYEQFPLGGMVPAVAGAYKPALRIKGMTAGMTLHLDDIEVSIERLHLHAPSTGRCSPCLSVVALWQHWALSCVCYNA